MGQVNSVCLSEIHFHSGKMSFQDGIHILKVREIKRLGIKSMVFGVYLDNIDQTCPNCQTVMLTAMSSLIEFVFSDADQNAKVCLTMSHPLVNKKIGIPLSRREILTAEKVIATMEEFFENEIGAFLWDDRCMWEWYNRWTIEAVRIPEKRL